ncbi:MAG: metallophosphoesterase [Flavobacteriales bacterium]|jgi:predicted MPP superfamily phosphohydrolase
MSSRFLIFLGSISLIMFIIDIYGYMGIRQLTSNLELPWKKIWRWAWWIPSIVTVVLYIVMIARFQQLQETKSYAFFSFVQAVTFIFVIPKLIFVLFHFLNDLGWIGQWTAEKVKSQITSEPHEKMNRLQFFNQLGLAAGVLMMGAITYGVTRGKYAFRILSERINFPNLPKAFDGTRIVQISDAHLGSFLEDSYEEVREAIEMINDLNPDYIVFTGDMVNNYAFEAEPWIDHFKGLKATKGKFSILGNHDYGDYGFDRNNPDDIKKKSESFERLVEIHKEMGFTLLRNQNVLLEKGGESIRLLGMENWGKGFQQYGDFSKTLEGTDENEFKILLSHDPTHWEEQVLGKAKVDLTLSGHTHGMQFGVELPKLGIKLSPASLRYKRWGGLYSENSQYLHINRGFGFLGFPGRVGMPPEITCIDIYSA